MIAVRQDCVIGKNAQLKSMKSGCSLSGYFGVILVHMTRSLLWKGCSRVTKNGVKFYEGDEYGRGDFCMPTINVKWYRS